MGIWRKLFGGKREPPPATDEDTDEDTGFDTDAMLEELESEGPQARAGDVDINSSPKQVCRYVFVRLAAGTPAGPLRADLVQRGFSGKVADAYITLIQGTLFKGR